MSFANYTAFTTSLSSWMDIGTSDIGASLYADLITVAESRIFREARTRDMEESFSTVIGSGTIGVPSGYLELKSAYIDSSPVQSLERRKAEWIYSEYPLRSSEGPPKYIAREGSTFIFGPYPDSAYTVKGVRYMQPTAISASSVSSFFTNNPDLYLFACLAESEIIIGRDNRIPVWEAKYQKILAQVNGLDEREDQSGSNLQMRVVGANGYRMR